MFQSPELESLNFLIGLKFKDLVRGPLSDSWHIGDYFIDRKTLEVTKSKTNAKKLAGLGVLVAVNCGGIISQIYCNKENADYKVKRFHQINTKISMTHNGLTINA